MAKKQEVERVRELALEFLQDCVGECEADGYQQARDLDTPWVDLEPVLERDGNTLLLTMGMFVFRLTATRAHREERELRARYKTV